MAFLRHLLWERVTPRLGALSSQDDERRTLYAVCSGWLTAMKDARHFDGRHADTQSTTCSHRVP